MTSTGVKFMESPLVVWVETFRPKGSPSLQYSDLYDGVFLCNVMQQIDSRPAYQNINHMVRDVNVRMHNWDILLRNIKAYYLDVLQQLLVVRLPNIHALCREPEKDVGFNELKKALLLILGCAIQCERKETFIETIKGLELEVQQDIVENIKQITDDSESILPTEMPEHLEPYTEKMFHHLTRLLKERDNYAEMMAELVQERDFYQSQVEGRATPLSPTGSPEKHHMAVELADCKARVRRLRQELEEKQEQLSDVSDELEEHKITMTKLRNENVALMKDARSARSLRDELDVLREKMSSVNNYEAKILKYKEKINEMDFYKARVEELREDNAILVESKGVLEEQLENSHKRIETVIQLEQELLKYRQQIEEFAQERDTDRERIRLLAEENAQLQFQKKSSMNESTNLEQELESTKARIAGIGGAISDQLKETTNAKLLRLELENKRLQQKVEDMRESSLIENTGLNLELEKENRRLAKKVEQLQATGKETAERNIDLEERSREFVREKDQLLQAIEMTKESAERQLKELEREKDSLSQTIEVIRVRNEQTTDTKLKDLEQENKKLHQTVSQKNQMLSKFEFENKQLTKSYQRTKQTADKVSELEVDKEHLEKDNFDLRKSVQTLQLSCDKVEKLEQECSDLDVENKRLQKTVKSLQTAVQRKEQLEQQNIDLTVENKKLQRTLDNMKSSSSKMVDLENEKTLLNRELQQLRRTMESKKTQSVKLEQMELDIMDLDNENMKLQRTVEVTTNRVEQLEKDNTDLENENEKLQETIESMKYSQKRLNELERENTELEQELTKVQKEKAVLLKENKRCKVTMETRESAIDQLTTKNSVLDREQKELKRQVERQAVTSSHMKDTEKENRDLLQQLSTERQTIDKLRTDLVNEKIRTQEMTNEMERLNQDLQRVGINKEQLVKAATPGNDESQFKALENMLGETLKKSIEIKDEKIQALQSRLDESKNRNLRLQEDLRLVRSECESLKQRYEEEALGKEREREVAHPVRNSPFMTQGGSNTTREILELKDHLVKVERNNATLMAENSNLKSQRDSLGNQVQKLEAQVSQLQSQMSAIHGQSSALQSQNAKLQVENSTLQSECASRAAHTKGLQNQICSMETVQEKCQQAYEDLKEKSRQSYHDLKADRDQLLKDHNTLQTIHDQATQEYEGLISEHGSLKSIHKSTKNELRELQQQLNSLRHGKDDDHRVQALLDQEKQQLNMERRSLGNLQMDYNRLRDEHDHLLGANSNLEREYRDVLAENKKAKDELNMVQQDHADMKEKLRTTEREFDLLVNRFYSLDDNYQKALEDKEQLMKQVELLINRNQDLLSNVLSSKDQIVGKEKHYMEQLSDLRRQKERLEEKIMDHYKNREKQKKNRSFGAIMVQKVRGLMKSQRSKSRPNLAEGSPDNSSLGSGSFADPGDHEFSRKSDKRRRRRGSAGTLPGTHSPHLSKQNKSLAKSTTALGSSSDANSSLSDLRGAKSTEDLLSDTLRSHGDCMSFSQSASTFQLLPGMGRPASDDEGGFQETENMLTLEEFLAESDDKSPNKKGASDGKQEDSESRSSENSDHSGRRLQSRKPAPLPPGVHLNNARRMDSMPDVAAVSQSDLSVSRLSRVSTGSSGSSQDVRSDSAFTPVLSPSSLSMQPSNTSTPLKNQTQFRFKQYEDVNNYSRGEDRQDGSSVDRLTPDRPSHYNYYSSQPKDQSFSQQREPTPERENKLTPDARLELLTHGNNVFSPNSSSPNSEGWSPASNISSPRDQRPRTEVDMSVRSAQIRPDSSLQPNRGRGQSSQNSRPPLRATGQAGGHSPGRHQEWEDRSPSRQSYPDSSPSRPAVPNNRNPTSPNSGKRERTILVSRSNIGPRPYGQKNPNVIRARPQSAFGAPIKSQQQPESSAGSQLNNARTVQDRAAETRASYGEQYNNGPSPAQHNGPVQLRHNNNRPTHRMERPKSVPPTMFNADGGPDSDSGLNKNNNYQISPTKGTPPVPPPRKNRDILTSGRYSILREPNTSSMIPSANMNSSRGPLNNSPSSNLVNSGGMGQGQSSGLRMAPQGQNNLAHNKPPAPKPMKPDETGGDPKQNSIWYEYGCV